MLPLFANAPKKPSADIAAQRDAATIGYLEAFCVDCEDLIRQNEGWGDAAFKAFARSASQIFLEIEDLGRAGLHEEAARRFALLTHPKYRSLSDCRVAYAAARGRGYAPPEPRLELDRLHSAVASLPLFS